MKCREVLGHIVMTIFYEVDPTDIKKLTGDFGKAFRKSCKGKTKEHNERWRKALEDVATIAGEHSRNWINEVAMSEKIATDVSNMLNSSTPSRDFDGFVGMRAHLERMEQLLRLDLDEVRMIGIWGPFGIGKTTIARVLFNHVSSSFQMGAFVVDIKGYYPRPCLDEYSAQLQLQNRMLSQIINQKDIMISHLGVAQERLKTKKVFLVLDEVDQLGQLDALAKEIQWFGPGSWIIITTEDLGVLKDHGINHIYKVDFPSNDEAFQILCMHAFGQKYPDDGFYELAWEVTNLVGNLPLGLKVLGSTLQGKSKQEWKRTLPRLKTLLEGKIESIIKFSYDALCDEDKDLFLYIACLFNYRSAHKVEEVLANKFSHVRHGLHGLVEKSLISINEDWIKMHTLLEQFGRQTSRKQFVYHGLTKRQLLVDARDICEVLSDDITDSRRFIGINLNLFQTMEELNISEKALERMSDLQFVKIKGNDHPKRVHSLLYHSQKIRSLHWEDFQNICLPSTFNPEFLVELVMHHSKLQKLWEGTKQLRNLKWMDLSDSTDLKELPNLSTAINLEELILKNCSSLVELPAIENATKLWILDLQGCSNLLDLPSIYATNLQELDISGCSSLMKLPPSIGKLTNLQRLDFRYCLNLVELPSIYATNLQKLDISGCSSLVRLPSSIGYLTNLEILNLSNCSSLLKLPPSIGTATNLQYLDISGCSSLVKLPSSIGYLTNFEILNLSNCSSLLELPPSIGTATNLQELDISGCSSLMELPDSIGDITNLKGFYLSHCSNLVELPSSIGKLTNLQRLDFRCCSNLVELPSIYATNLQKLDISGCSSLVKLPSSIGYLTNLEILDLGNCSSLLELPPSIGTATNLKHLDISGCSSLVELPSFIGDFTNLRTFNLSNCSSLVVLPSSIGNLQKLRWLIMCRCSKLEALPTNINLESLSLLDLTDCSQLKSFPEISTNIEDLRLIRTAVKEVPFSIMSWSRLSHFYVSYFESLKEFPYAHDIITELHLDEDIQEVPPWVKGLSRLRSIRLYNCNNLVSLPQLSDSLYEIVAENCQSLERLDCSFNNPKICLNFPKCFNLNQEARDLIMHTSTPHYAILPGTQVPDCFNHRATAGGSLKIKLNESPLPTSLKFKACIMLVKVNEDTGDDQISMEDDESWMGDDETWVEDESSTSVHIYIMNKQKDLKVRCTPISHYLYPLLTEHIYTFEVEAKEVTSTELVFEFKPVNSKWKIGGCGLLQIKSWRFLHVNEHDESFRDNIDGGDWEKNTQ